LLERPKELPAHWIPETRHRLAQRRAKKPDTKFGQFWSLWPEIKAALGDGQSVRTLRQWLEEDAALVLTISTLTSYISRSRKRDLLRREAETADAFFRVQTQQTGSTRAQPAGSGSFQIVENAAVPSSDESSGPLAAAMRALNRRRFDIRQVHGDGDPSDKNLI
jgi:hypothetical protein